MLFYYFVVIGPTSFAYFSFHTYVHSLVGCQLRVGKNIHFFSRYLQCCPQLALVGRKSTKRFVRAIRHRNYFRMQNMLYVFHYRINQFMRSENERRNEMKWKNNNRIEQKQQQSQAQWRERAEEKIWAHHVGSATQFSNFCFFPLAYCQIVYKPYVYKCT